MKIYQKFNTIYNYMSNKIITISSLNALFRKSELQNDTNINLNGWVRTNRNNGTLGFIEFNDGTTLKNLQIVYDKNTANFDVASKVRTGASIYVEGKVVLTPENKQPFEVLTTSVSLVGEVSDDYPLQNYDKLNAISDMPGSRILYKGTIKGNSTDEFDFKTWISDAYKNYDKNEKFIYKIRGN